MTTTNGTNGTNGAGKAAGLLGPPRTATYRPTVAYSPQMPGLWGTGAFTLSIVEEMRRDDQVSLCLEYKTVPLHQASFEVNAANPEEKQFVAETLESFWRKDLDTALECVAYGFSGSEALYKANGRRIEFDCLKPVHARDLRIFTAKGSLSHLSVGNIKDYQAGHDVILESARDNRPAKGVLFVHNSTYSPWRGKSALIPSYLPWRAKTMPESGGLESIFRFAYKHAFSGFQIRHPQYVYADTPGQEPIPAENYARQMGEQIHNGAVVTLDSATDNHGNYLWLIEQYGKVEGDFSGLIDYVEFLNRLIARGIGIPDELLTHDGNTGGYSRSKVSIMAFYLAAERMLANILDAFDRQILRPLVTLNFRMPTYSVKPGRLIPPDEPQQQPGGAEIPGAADGMEPTEQPDEDMPEPDAVVGDDQADPLAGLLGS